MAELGTAKRSALSNRCEDRQDKERGVERLEPAAQNPLDQIDRGDRDRQRAQDQSELLPKNKLRELVQIEVLPEHRYEVRERKRPHGVNDSRDRHEGHFEKVA